jgi:phosphoserine phosphatase
MTLESWNNTQTKQNILDFVRAVTAEGGPDYVPPVERIATFDNDGTLWCEHPVPVQFQFALDALALLAKKKPQLLEQPLYKAAAEKDLGWFVPYLNNKRLPELIGMLLAPLAGETQTAYDARASAWLKTARHPRFNKPYLQMVFQPMAELLYYLRANDFRVFIVTGGGMDFVRLFCERVYGVASENVVGDNLKLSWEYRDGTPQLVRQAGIVDPFCDGPGKPINIQLHVGRPPILASGNSNGDVPMMEFATASGKPYLCLLVHHDDAQREYDSDHSAEVALKTAEERNWTTVSVEEDFKTVFRE